MFSHFCTYWWSKMYEGTDLWERQISLFEITCRLVIGEQNRVG